MYETTTVLRNDLWLMNPDGKVAVLERVRPPHADWWLPGGRFRPGLEPPAAALHQVWRDFGLSIGDGRLMQVGMVHYEWGMPSYGITAQLAGLVWHGELTSIEVAGMRISPKYRQLVWCDPAVLAEPQDDGYHSSLAEIAKSVVTRHHR
jgi:ADP-ribose pyrophosphatase YjhB (NUDIX family)